MTRLRSRWVLIGAILVAVAVVAVLVAARATHHGSQDLALVRNQALDPGMPLSAAAPDFTLTDQFGDAASLRSYRGGVVILAFNDPECTTICPLTTTAMADAKAMLGAAGARVQLLGIAANPSATSVSDVRAYSEVHGMVHDWRFLTGSLEQLKAVWRAYHIDVAIERGLIDHTPALYVIDPRGRLSKLYLTQQSYAAVPQLGQLLAQDASRLLPGHPRVNSHLSYAEISGLGPSVKSAAPQAGGGTLTLGPGPAPRLYLFFATWDQEVTDLGSQLRALSSYQDAARRAGLPELTVVDEGSVEPSPGALPTFLIKLGRPLSYPVAIDPSGRIGDGYGVQDEPWFTLISADGHFLWYYDVATLGWLSRSALERKVREALAVAHPAPGAAALVGSPAPLAALHAQADRLLDGEPALAARIRALRDFPIVVNVWASWCAPCRAEFRLLASASASYGRKVAFLGADVNDATGDAQAFLDSHHVSYPSYRLASDQLTGIFPAGLLGMPTTFFLGRDGKVSYVHTGQYDAQGTLDGDVAAYALGK